MKLAGLVLAVEAAKGAGAVLVGQVLAGDEGAIAAGIATVAGNVFNPWYRLHGGKGLGISAGVLITMWPAAFPLSISVIVLAVVITRSSGLSTLSTIAALNLMGLGWYLFEWPNAWGIERTKLLPVLALGITVIVWRRHYADWQLKKQGRLSHQESS